MAFHGSWVTQPPVVEHRYGVSWIMGHTAPCGGTQIWCFMDHGSHSPLWWNTDMVFHGSWVTQPPVVEHRYGVSWIMGHTAPCGGTEIWCFMDHGSHSPLWSSIDTV